MSAPASIPRASGSRAMLLIASLAAFMAFLDTTIVNIAFPALERAFRAESSSPVSWVLNAYNIVFAALLIPAGQLAERYDRRKLFDADSRSSLSRPDAAPSRRRSERSSPAGRSRQWVLRS